MFRFTKASATYALLLKRKIGPHEPVRVMMCALTLFVEISHVANQHSLHFPARALSLPMPQPQYGYCCAAVANIVFIVKQFTEAEFSRGSVRDNALSSCFHCSTHIMVSVRTAHSRRASIGARPPLSDDKKGSLTVERYTCTCSVLILLFSSQW